MISQCSLFASQTNMIQANGNDVRMAAYQNTIAGLKYGAKGVETRYGTFLEQYETPEQTRMHLISAACFLGAAVLFLMLAIQSFMDSQKRALYPFLQRLITEDDDYHDLSSDESSSATPGASSWEDSYCHSIVR